MLYAIFIFLVQILGLFSLDIPKCCKDRQVSDDCASLLCNPETPPGDFKVYDLFNSQHNCSVYMKEIAGCLSQRRNHKDCCMAEAFDKDQGECFSLCEGKGIGRDVSLSRYQSCMAVNLPSMFGCFSKGYDAIPSPPTSIIVEKIRSTSVELSWTPPTMKEPMEFKYEVMFDEVNTENTEQESVFFEKTLRSSVTLEELYPGTKYYAYVIASSIDGSKRSLASDVLVFQTVGVAPLIRPFKNQVYTSVESTDVVLACRIQASGNSISQISWEKQTSDGSFEAVEATRAKIGGYKSFEEELREFVTILEVLQPGLGDLGVYRCKIADQYGEAMADVELKEAFVEMASSEPPDTILDCCHKKDVHKKCLSMCGSVSTQTRIRSPYMPKNCSLELPKVVSCSMPNIDESQCCILHRVPIVCMYLCDSSFTPNHRIPEVCRESIHLQTAQKCRFAGLIRKPSAVENLKVITNLENDETFLEWLPSERAEIYHVYWRKITDGGWNVKSTRDVQLKIGPADEVRIVAANSHGISQYVELIL